MRKARRAAEMQPDPSQMPYPQYGYPAQQGPPQQDPYMPVPGGYSQGYGSPVPPGGYGYPPQGQPMGQPMMMGAEQSNTFGIPGQFLQNPAVANMALQYGQSMLGQTKDRIDQELNKLVKLLVAILNFCLSISHLFH